MLAPPFKLLGWGRGAGPPGPPLPTPMNKVPFSTGRSMSSSFYKMYLHQQSPNILIFFQFHLKIIDAIRLLF